jgi:hypothetical protein
VFSCLESVCLFSVILMKWSLPSPFIDARGVQGYKYVLRDIFLERKDPKTLVCSRWCVAVGGVAFILRRCSDVL